VLVQRHFFLLSRSSRRETKTLKRQLTSLLWRLVLHDGVAGTFGLVGAIKASSACAQPIQLSRGTLSRPSDAENEE
jgi:hypothetical protein